MRRLIPVVLMLAGCVSTLPPMVVNVVPLGAPGSQSAIPADSVQFVDPAPTCPSIARLSTRVTTYDSEKGMAALREKAGTLGANRLVLTVTDGGAEEELGLSVPMIFQSALALRCS